MYGAIARALRAAGVDAISTHEAGRLGESDESQLEWATAEQRAFVTFNVAHVSALHDVWLQQDRHHAGIVVSSQWTLRDLRRRLLKLAKALDAETMRDRL